VNNSSGRTTTFGVIGLGYVGLPLAVEAGRAEMKVKGFDISERVVESGVDRGGVGPTQSGQHGQCRQGHAAAAQGDEHLPPAGGHARCA